MQEESDRERLKEVEQEMIRRELEATEQQLQVNTHRVITPRGANPCRLL